ncbi:MAG: hypothetical protein UW70_C0016G0007 [Candidatus Peregrinibacteria bacterium GW2011_GWA2_44_7]|nr:MAG: hypothetical protein UW70_C0016G0007 [Candidatus Peregrinibacteria bacterium GW2011_GWA2_44_7]
MTPLLATSTTSIDKIRVIKNSKIIRFNYFSSQISNDVEILEPSPRVKFKMENIAKILDQIF